MKILRLLKIVAVFRNNFKFEFLQNSLIKHDFLLRCKIAFSTVKKNRLSSLLKNNECFIHS